MVKKLIAVTAVVVAVLAVSVAGKNITKVTADDGQTNSVAVNAEKTDETYTSIEFDVSEGALCTKAEIDAFLAEIEPDFSDIIERVWVNGWQGEAGVQGSTLDDVIYRTYGMLDKNAYITSTCEDIKDMWEAGEKVVLVGEKLVTDETTYRIGDEEYRIVGIFREGPMEDHMALPLDAYPEIDTINVFCIGFKKALTDSQMEQLETALDKTFGEKVTILQ